MATMFWIWMAAAALFLILEMASPTLVYICFVAGSIAAGAYASHSPEAYWWQVGVFIVVSLVLLPLTRQLAKKITKDPPQKSNVDRMIGQTALVTETIDPDRGGKVKIEREIWVAISTEMIEVNARVRIVSVTGTRVQVERISS